MCRDNTTRRDEWLCFAIITWRDQWFCFAKQEQRTGELRSSILIPARRSNANWWRWTWPLACFYPRTTRLLTGFSLLLTFSSLRHLLADRYLLRSLLDGRLGKETNGGRAFQISECLACYLPFDHPPYPCNSRIFSSSLDPLRIFTHCQMSSAWVVFLKTGLSGLLHPFFLCSVSFLNLPYCGLIGIARRHLITSKFPIPTGNLSVPNLLSLYSTFLSWISQLDR